MVRFRITAAVAVAAVGVLVGCAAEPDWAPPPAIGSDPPPASPAIECGPGLTYGTPRYTDTVYSDEIAGPLTEWGDRAPDCAFLTDAAYAVNQTYVFTALTTEEVDALITAFAEMHLRKDRYSRSKLYGYPPGADITDGAQEVYQESSTEPLLPSALGLVDFHYELVKEIRQKNRASHYRTIMIEGYSHGPYAPDGGELTLPEGELFVVVAYDERF